MRRAALIFLTAPVLGFVPPKLVLERRTHAAVVRVVDAGQTYSTINTIDCLGWPSDAIKQAAGLSGWSGWSPKNGDRGVAIGRSKHCFQDVMVIFVRIGEHVVPLGTRGLELEAGSFEDLPLFVR